MTGQTVAGPQTGQEEDEEIGEEGAPEVIDEDGSPGGGDEFPKQKGRLLRGEVVEEEGGRHVIDGLVGAREPSGIRPDEGDLSKPVGMFEGPIEDLSLVVQAKHVNPPPPFASPSTKGARKVSTPRPHIQDRDAVPWVRKVDLDKARQRFQEGRSPAQIAVDSGYVLKVSCDLPGIAGGKV